MICLILMAGMFFSPIGLLNEDAAAAIAKKSSNKQSLSKELYRVSGMEKEKRILSKMKLPPDIFTGTKMLQSIGLSAEHIDLINSVYKGSFNLNDFYKTKYRRILKDYNNRHIRKAVKFFKSKLGRKVVRLEHESLNSSRGYKKFVQEITKNPPSKSRLTLVDRLENARTVVNYDLDNKASILRTVGPLNEELQAEDVEKLITKMKVEQREHQRSLHLIEDLFRYRSLTDKQLNKLVSFYESDEGQWFNKADKRGNADGIGVMNRKARRRVDSLLTILEASEQDKETIKTVFSPGLRYMFTNRRDPFDPLVKEEPPPVVAQVPTEDKGKKKRFDEEIKDLNTIPYELFKKLKQIDPTLYSDLEYYATSFRNKKRLEGLSQSDFENEVNNYKKLIEKARNYADQLVKTPLQAEIQNLKLSGVLWDGFGTVALVETQDTMGHTVRVGSLIGPNYGVVESIDQEKIIVVERVRDFKGSIFSVTQLIEFNQMVEN